MQQSEKRERRTRFIRALAWRNRDFTYPGGQLTDGQIRLIDIHPGKRGKELKCSLKTVQRSSENPYKALSYAWGDQNAKRKISIDGKDFWITYNLYAALTRIREKKWRVWLWADAICVCTKNLLMYKTRADALAFAFQINQADTLERNAEVQRMGEIFSDASEVIIWLGDTPDDSCQLEDVVYLASLGKNCTIDDILAREESLLAVFSSSWFTRLWVLQEFILARRNLVLLGLESCSLDALFPLLDASQTFRDKTFRIWNRPTINKFFDCFDLFRDMYDYTTELSRKDQGISPHQQLGTLIDRTRPRLCQDPRDHIFGLLGIGNCMGAHTIQADYSQSIREVYQDFMHRELLRDPYALIFFDSGYKGENDMDLPSWVADFSCPRGRERLYPGYLAGGNNHVFKLGADSFLLEQGTLILPGHRFDVVRGLSEPLRGEDLPIADKRLRDWCIAAENALGIWSTFTSYGAHMSQYQAYWRTLSGNHYGDLDFETMRWRSHSIPLDDSGAAYEIVAGRAIAIPRHVNPSENKAIVENLDGLYTTILRTMLGRRLLLTGTGYFCSGPQATEEGDVVVVIPGLRVPLVLRRRLNGSSYRLIGSAYVHGIMEGQFMERMEKSGDTKKETFYID